jgi:hypothetical protein
MRPTRKLSVLTAAAAIGVTGLAPATPASAAEVDLIAHLQGSVAYPNATGSSEYERNSYGRDVEVTVRHATSLTGTRLRVIVNHHRVGTMMVREGGYAHREWDTDRGESVPFASLGDPVRVRTPDGTLVVRAHYQVDPD